MGPFCGFTIFLGFPLYLLTASFILFASVAISNAILGPRNAPYPVRREERFRSPGRRAIPRPTIGQGAMIVFMYLVITAGVCLLVIGAAAGALGGAQDAAILVRLGSLLAGSLLSFLVLSAMCTALLPTTFARSCLVATFYTLMMVPTTIALYSGVTFVAGLIQAAR